MTKMPPPEPGEGKIEKPKETADWRQGLGFLGIYFLLGNVTERTKNLPWDEFLLVAVGVSAGLATVFTLYGRTLFGQPLRGRPWLVWIGLAAMLVALLSFGRWADEKNAREAGGPPVMAR